MDRQCTVCGVMKEWDPAQKRKSKASGFMGKVCWDCHREQHREWHREWRATEEGRVYSNAASCKRRTSTIGTVYLLTFIDNRQYVGSTTMPLQERLYQAARDKRTLVGRCWQIMGPPKAEVLWTGPHEETRAMERHYIDKYDCLWPKGLNKLKCTTNGKLSSAAS